MLARNKKERLKTWLVTFCSVGFFVVTLEMLEMCTRYKG